MVTEGWFGSCSRGDLVALALEDHGRGCEEALLHWQELMPLRQAFMAHGGEEEETGKVGTI